MFVPAARRLFSTGARGGLASEKSVVIVGGGVVGLAVSRALSKVPNLNLMLLEAEPHFGSATSSRNSCVLHAGIYYTHNSNKHNFCIDGHRQILNFCRNYNVDHELCGKLIVDDQKKGADSRAVLRGIYETGTHNGATLELIEDIDTIRRMEPSLHPEIGSAIFSPLVGVEWCIELCAGGAHLASKWVSARSSQRNFSKEIEHFLR